MIGDRGEWLAEKGGRGSGTRSRSKGRSREQKSGATRSPGLHFRTAGPTTAVDLEYVNGGVGIQVWIDDAAVSLKDGKGSMKVPGGLHYLSWLAWGAPDASVEMKIVAPEEAKYSRKGLIGSDFKNFWFHKFPVDSP